jgi:hypothetical protein
MAVKGYQNIVTDGIVLSVDAYNQKSYVSGNTDTYNLVSNNVSGGTLLNGVGYDENTWTLDGINDYLDFGDVLNLTSNFTFEVWVKPISTPIVTTTYPLFGKYTHQNTTPNYKGYYADYRNDGTFSIALRLDLGNADFKKTDNTFSIGKWYHYVTTFAGDGVTQPKIYINGVEEPITTFSSAGSILGGIDSSTNTFTIGASYAASSGNPFRYSNMHISNFKAYNRVLTPEEVNQNYNSTKWRFL